MAGERADRVFLVRMWREGSAGGDTWRGSVFDVASGRRYYLAATHEVADFVADALREADDERTSQRRGR